MNTLDAARLLFSYTQELRRDFHRHPELGFREERTAGVIERELNVLGLPIRKGVAGTGVIALLEGRKPGPVVMVRADIDALPIQEETGAEYASTVPGVMHACGHDGHTAIALTVAKLLNEHRGSLCGTVKFLFQPAEELLSGAAKMVEQGALSDPKPDFVLGMHLWNERPLGWLGIAAGPVYAAGSVFTVRIRGKGGHGAIPQLTHDPVTAAAYIITALQTAVARNLNPMDSGVVSVTAVHSGSTFNVIPSELEFQGTIRAHDLQALAFLEDRFRDIVTHVAQSLGTGVEVNIRRLTGPVVNDRQLANRVDRVARNLFPEVNIDAQFKTMASEDFAFLHEKCPGCFFFVGSSNAAAGLDSPHHNSHFDFDEGALLTSVSLMSAVVLDLLQDTPQ